jgi:4-hydroxy-2-oxoglutarate aldolase
MKDSGGDIVRMAEILRQVPADFQILAGSASFLLPALSIGAVGAVSALANIAAPQLTSLVQAYRTGDLVQARELQHRMMAPNRAVTAQFGVPGLKAAMEMVGFYGGPTRGPLIPLSDDQRTSLEYILDQAGLIPSE